MKSTSFVRSPVWRLAILACLPASTCGPSSGVFAADEAKTEAKTPTILPTTKLPDHTLLTLHFKNAPLREVLQAFVDQAHLEPLSQTTEFLLKRKTEPVSLDVDAQPFWLAVKALQEASGITFDEVGTDAQNLNISPTTGDRGLGGRLQTVGPVTFSIRSIEVKSSRRANLNQPAGQTPENAEDLQVQMRAFLDPALQIVVRSGSLEIEAAQDDQGRSLLDVATSQPLNTNANFILGTNVRLNTAAADAKTLRLKGALHVFLAEAPQTWEINDLNFIEAEKFSVKPLNRTPQNPQGDAPAQTKTVGNAQDPVVLGFDYMIRGRAERFYARLSFQRADSGLEFMPLTDAMFKDIKLVDAGGRELVGEHGGGGGSRGMSDPQAASQRYIFQAFFPAQGRAPADFVPAKLVWRVPGQLREIIVPFSFENLPLP